MQEVVAMLSLLSQWWRVSPVVHDVVGESGSPTLSPLVRAWPLACTHIGVSCGWQLPLVAVVLL